MVCFAGGSGFCTPRGCWCWCVLLGARGFAAPRFCSNTPLAPLCSNHRRQRAPALLPPQLAETSPAKTVQTPPPLPPHLAGVTLEVHRARQPLEALAAPLNLPNLLVGEGKGGFEAHVEGGKRFEGGGTEAGRAAGEGGWVWFRVGLWTCGGGRHGRHSPKAPPKAHPLRSGPNLNPKPTQNHPRPPPKKGPLVCVRVRLAFTSEVNDATARKRPPGETARPLGVWGFGVLGLGGGAQGPGFRGRRQVERRGVEFGG